MSELIDWTPSLTCRICGRKALTNSYLCRSCQRLRERLDTRGWKVDVDARLRAMAEQWDPEAGAFRCYFTGIALTEQHGSPRSATCEHLDPGDGARVALAAALINRMKTDLTEDLFRRLVKALARHFEHPEEPFDETAWPPDSGGGSRPA
jgi:hypothetical protein